MEEYIEQTVSRTYTGGKRTGNMLLSIAAILMMLLAAVCAAAAVGLSAEGAFKINWIAAAGIVAFIFLAWLFWRKKDAFCIDYDYSFCCDEISVSAIYNSRRRKNLIMLPVGCLHMCGSMESAAYRKISANNDVAKYKWYANEGRALYFILFEKEGRQCIALLELDDRMANAIKHSKQLSAGAWHEKEGN